MAITKRVIVDQIEVLRNGVIQIRFKKQFFEDGKELAYEYHRASLEPGASLDNQVKAVNVHLEAMGWPACDVSDVERIARIVAVEHTPARIAEFLAQK